MRDVGKVKNKFELKLDSNQVFFLFAGLAAYSALIFVLGVVIGRARRGEGGPIASGMVLPDQTPTPLTRIEDRVASAQPKATEEPELPLGFYETLENGTTVTAKSTPVTPVSTAKPVATSVAITAGSSTVAPPTATTNPVAAGTTAVAVATLPPSAANGSFTLQVIAYNDLGQAQKAVATLRGRGFDAYTVTAQVAGKGTIHRVRIGRYQSRPDAENAAGTLIASDPAMKPMVVSYE